MSITSYESAFQMRLIKKLNDRADTLLDDLSNGSARATTPDQTGAKYEFSVGYLQALRDVAGMMSEVESDLLGRTRE